MLESLDGSVGPLRDTVREKYTLNLATTIDLCSYGLHKKQGSGCASLFRQKCFNISLQVPLKNLGRGAGSTT